MQRYKIIDNYSLLLIYFIPEKKHLQTASAFSKFILIYNLIHIRKVIIILTVS